MARLESRRSIEKRYLICKAAQDDPCLTVRDLRKMFGAGFPLVRDALDTGLDTWAALLGIDGGGENGDDGRSDMLLVHAKPVVKQDTVTGFEYREVPGGGWVRLDCRTVRGVIDDLGELGFSLLAASSRSRLHGPFQDEYELWFVDVAARTREALVAGAVHR